MDITDVAFALAGAIAGAGGSFVWLQRKLAAATEGRAGAAAEQRAAVARAHELLRERDVAKAELDRLKVEHAQAFATLDAERRAANDRLAEVKALQEKLDARMRETFSSLATATLQTSGKQLIELAKAELNRESEKAKVDLDARQKAIELTMKPVDDTLKKVGESLERSRAESAQLFSQVKMLGHETSNLVKALRTPYVRGRWGEQTLKRVVEMAQMVNHCDFVEQQTVDSDEGRLRPDLIVNMPGGRRVVVDAKVPLDRYLAMVEAQDDATRAAAMKAHTVQVRDHVTKLSSRAYWEALSPSPELVIMFVPAESLMSTALQDDPGLIEFGVSKNVVIASPLTLVALLKAIAYGWRQERIAKNAEDIRALGQELYTRVRGMAEHFGDVGQRLQSAVNSYNKTIGSLESRVLSGARKFVDLSAATTDSPIAELMPIELTPRLLGADELKTRKVKPADTGQGDLLAKVTGSD